MEKRSRHNVPLTLDPVSGPLQPMPIQPANGHHYNDQMACKQCGRTWEQHRLRPAPCPYPMTDYQLRRDGDLRR